MKKNTLTKKIRFSKADFDKIKETVQQNEKDTTGEICLALTAESAHYSFWELLAANIFASIVLIVLLFFSDKISNIYSHIYWQNEPSFIMPAFFIISCFSCVALAFFLFNIPFFDRMIIPSAVKKQSVTQRAFRYFTEGAVYETKEHSGILIFVSFLEREVRIVADKGIAEKISQDMWNLIADELADNLKKKEYLNGFQTCITRCGQLLKENFPSSGENPNELSDGLVILEDPSWY